MVTRRKANETFGERLKEARDAKGQSQPEAALELGIGQSTYNRWERDQVGRIEPESIPRACAYLGIDDSDYLGVLIIRGTVKRAQQEGRLP